MLIKKNNDIGAYFFVLPSLLLYIPFMLIPMVKTLFISFQKWNGASAVREWVGFANYIRLFQDEIFWKALSHNILWVAFNITVPLIIGLLLSNILNGRVRGKIIFRVTYFLPYILSLVVVGIVWSWIYNPVFGKLNGILIALGLENLACGWLGNENTALLSLMAAGSWTAYGFCMVILLAGMQSIDNDVYEYLYIEGGNSFQKFFYITLPMIRSTMTALILFLTIGSLRVFDIVYTMTKGGPFYTTETIATYLYMKAFKNNQIGYGSSLAVILTLLILLISIFYIKYTDKRND